MTALNSRLERRYRRLLRAYPPTVRDDRAEEILATLAEGTAPGRHLPAAREAAALVVEGLRARARLAAAGGPRQLWAEGLHLAATLLALVKLGELARLGGFFPIWTAIALGGTVALLLARLRLALVLLAVTALGACAGLLGIGWDWAPSEPVWWAAVGYAVLLPVVAVLALSPLRAGVPRRSLWWLLLPAGQIAATLLALRLWGMLAVADSGLTWLAVLALDASVLAPSVVVVVAALALATLAYDPRPALAAVLLLLPDLVLTVTALRFMDPVSIGFWLLMLAAVALLPAAARRAHRLQRDRL